MGSWILDLEHILGRFLENPSRVVDLGGIGGGVLVGKWNRPRGREERRVGIGVVVI